MSAPSSTNSHFCLVCRRNVPLNFFRIFFDEVFKATKFGDVHHHELSAVNDRQSSLSRYSQTCVHTGPHIFQDRKIKFDRNPNCDPMNIQILGTQGKINNRKIGSIKDPKWCLTGPPGALTCPSASPNTLGPYGAYGRPPFGSTAPSFSKNSRGFSLRYLFFPIFVMAGPDM